MKRMFLSALLAVMPLAAGAEERVLFNFENYSKGDRVAMKDFYSGTTESVAEVVADPRNAANQVLHVVNKSWNTHVELPLDGLTADEMTGNYQYIAFDLYRPASDTDRYKQFSVRVDNDTIYADDGFYDQGDNERWTVRSYRMKRVAGAGTKLYLGYNSINAEFYIDNIRLIGTDYTYDPNDPEQSLRHHAGRCGRRIGVAVPAWRIDLGNDDQDITRTIYGNFNMVVAENEMKIDALQPNRGEFSFYNADRLVDFAARHDMDVRGHTLVWHSQMPKWMSADGYQNDKGYTRSELLKIMENHITTVMKHFKGKVVEWDVVNECLDDNQSVVYSNPNGYTLRPSVWKTVIGEEFLDSAFAYARRADPDVKLFINDYGVELQGRAKAQAYYNLIKKLKGRGVPIDGVGLQSHLTLGELDSTAFDNNVKRYAALGLECIVTELDISVQNTGSLTDLERQGAEYRTIANILLHYNHCPDLLVWGVKDDMSWREGAPLLFDSELTPKPAFFSLRDAFSRHADATAVEAVRTGRTLSPVVNVYDLSGRPVARGMLRTALDSLPDGLYIVDGKVVAVKRR